MKWLNRCLWAFIILYLAVGGHWILSAYLWGHGLYKKGMPVGIDFADYYAVSTLCIEGTPAPVYDPTKLNATINRLTGADTSRNWWNCSYPPSALLMMLPLALLPYSVSLWLWLSITLGIALLILWRISPHPATIKLAFAFPGTFLNFMWGQNSFLSVCFLGGGLLLLDRFPFVGGFLLGLMSYKPQLALLIPVALVGGKRWKALSGAAVAALSVVFLSVLVFGSEIWVTFWKYFFSVPPNWLLGRSGLWPFVVTTFASARLLGSGSGIAWILQGMVTVAAAGVVFWVWRREAPYPICASVLALGTLLATPYVIFYDTFILSLPIAWIGWDRFNHGWRPGEKFVLPIVWLSPLIVRFLAMATGLQLGPIIFAAFLGLLIMKGPQTSGARLQIPKPCCELRVAR